MKKVVILTNDSDSSSIRVLEWLAYKNVSYYRINSDFDFLDFLTGLDYSSDLSIWYRKQISAYNSPGKFSGSFDDKQINHHLMRELMFYKEYISDNHNVKKLCSDKYYNLNRLTTLSLARKKGIVIPVFRIVTQKKELIEFYNIYKNNSGIVLKCLSDGISIKISQNFIVSYTERVSEKDIDRIPKNFFPSLIMENIEKKIDIRSFYLDGIFYSMAIFSQEDPKTSTDFRRYNYKRPNRTVPYQLPHNIEIKLKKVFDELELNTGSVDMIKDINNRFVFLEINPYGQYDMVSKPCNYHIHKKISEYLCS